MKGLCIKRAFRAWLLSLVFLIPGCLSYNVKFMGLHPSVNPLKERPYKVLGEAESQASNYTFFWFWTVTPDVDFTRAYREMISEKGGDDIINVRMWRERKHWIVGVITIIHIKGTVIRYQE